MDALPIHEVNGTEFDSTRPGIMHACGHDSHTAMLLGAATLLKGLADEGRLPGTIRLLFQPSEEAQDAEGKSGGMRMAEEGALQGLDAVFGLHVDAYHDVGSVATRPGPMMAAADMFTLVIRGSGGHAARPQNTVDPIALSGLVIAAVQQVVSRRLDPTEPGVITIGTIHGGTVNNVIPDTVEMTGTIRSFSPAARATLHDGAAQGRPRRGAAGRQRRADHPGRLSAHGERPGRHRADDGRHARPAGRRPGAQQRADHGRRGLQLHGPGRARLFLRLGVHNPGWKEHYPVHRADFRLDEDALPIGTAAGHDRAAVDGGEEVRARHGATRQGTARHSEGTETGTEGEEDTKRYTETVGGTRRRA